MADNLAIVRRVKAALARVRAKAAAESSGKLRVELRRIVAALDGLINCTGPHARPGLARAVIGEGGEIDAVVRYTWSAAHKVILAIEKSTAPYPYHPAMADIVGQRYTAAAKGLCSTMGELRKRWGYPADFWELDLGEYRDSHAIRHPIVEPAEHGLLIFYRVELAVVMRELERIELAKPVAPRKATTTGTTVQSGGDERVWGPWIACSKTKLAKALVDGEKSNASTVIKRMVTADELQIREAKNPLNGYQRWAARIKDPGLREKVRTALGG